MNFGRSARDDYPLLVLRWQGDMATVDTRIEQHKAMCEEIDRLRAEVERLRTTWTPPDRQWSEPT